MTVLETARLLLAELPLEIARRRLNTPGFLTEVPLPAEPQTVTFPAA